MIMADWHGAAGVFWPEAERVMDRRLDIRAVAVRSSQQEEPIGFNTIWAASHLHRDGAHAE